MKNNAKNNVQLTGNLGSVAEITTFESGKKLARVSIAINEDYKADNKEVKKTTWINLAFWNEKTELVENLQKGDFVEVNGKLSIGEYTDKDGNKKQTTEVVIFDLKKIEKVAE